VLDIMLQSFRNFLMQRFFIGMDSLSQSSEQRSIAALHKDQNTSG
jgi:hypothetical protein